MARPTKFDQKTADKILDFIRSGLSMKDACFGVGIGESSFARYRKQYPEFGEAVQEALLARQWNSPEAIKRYHSKQKKINTINTAFAVQNALSEIEEKTLRHINTSFGDGKALAEALRASEEQSSEREDPQFYAGLPIRQEPLETYDFDVEPFINPKYDCVEWVKDGVLHSCPLRLWLERQKPKPEPWFIVV